jgi:hypothetical protein
MDGTTQEYMLECNHRFHTECIIDSLRRNPECPVCRDTGGILQPVSGNNEYDLFFLPPIQHHTNDKKHINECVSCGKNNPESDIYFMYQLIKKMGQELIMDKYSNLPQLNQDLKEVEVHFKNDLQTKLFKLESKYNLEKQYLYHNMGNSDIYKKYTDIKKQTKMINHTFKKNFVELIKDIGYDTTDEDFTNILNEFYKTCIKKKHNWSFINELLLCRKYALKKYAPPASNEL